MTMQQNQDLLIDSAEGILHAFDNTNICIFMYYPQTKTIVIPENTCNRYQCEPIYKDMPESFASAMVLQDDHEQFKEIYYKINRGEKTAATQFHSKDLEYCWRVTLSTLTWSKDHKPLEVVGIIEDVTVEYKDKQYIKKIQITQQKTLFEAQHDPMTGVYNRKGFEEIIMEPRFRDGEIGFAIIDVDNFKMVNDEYGHEVGDRILTELAKQLVGVFRNEDRVIRLGGDEFGILLSNCDASMWKTFCTKQQRIHSALEEHFSGITITLSVGICFSKEGYSEILYNRADEALYETKRNGRAGCTLIDKETKEKKSWCDESYALRSKNVLAYSNTALFRIEIPKEKGEKHRLICGDAMKRLFCIPEGASPETCFEYWIRRVDPAYIETLDKMRATAMQNKQAECTYRWMHPEFGEIYIRCGGVGEESEDMNIFYGYHHSMKDTEIIEKMDDSRQMVSALSGIYFCSYYVNLTQNRISTVKFSMGRKQPDMEETKASDRLEGFIFQQVHPEDRKKMMQFTDLSTLVQRMGKEKHLDCEYMSLADKEWCRASFYPVRYDLAGQLTHVLFVVTYLDANKAKEIEENKYNKKSLFELFNNVPGGVVMYEWNGSKLTALHISEHFREKYGDIMKHNESPDYRGIHPDDLQGYKEATRKALEGLKQLEYVFRGWNKEESRYVWIKVNAYGEDQPDGTMLVYAIYTDITQQKEVEQKMEKSKASLSAALRASNQLCYEYDAKTHTGECLTESNFFHLPKVIENYPESLRKYDLLHPDDVDLFIQTAHQVDASARQVHCDVRMKKEGEYRWYSCTYNSYYDSVKEHNVAILTVVDISMRMAAVQAYESRMKVLLGMNEKSLSIITFNLTEDTFTCIKVGEHVSTGLEESQSFSKLFEMASQYVIGESQREQYKKQFNRDYLLEMARKGQMHLEMEHLYRMEPQHTEWLLSVVEMIKNPITNEIMGVCYAKSIQETKVTSQLLKKALERDYLMAAAVYVETGEYYLFRSAHGEYCSYRQNFWDNAKKALLAVTDSATAEQILDAGQREKIFAQLEKGQEFVYAFDGTLNGSKCRMELKVDYMSKDHMLILASLRNITDTVIMERLRHDNEHDPLTDLYNRKTVFRKCKKLLEDYPDEQFVMAHADMKHFHLYNTFFGEDAADELVCNVADMLRTLDADYDHWAYGRIESDVFCLFFPYDQEKYDRQLQYVLHQLKVHEKNFLIEPKIGIYRVTDPSMSIEAMFARATIAAKTAGIGVSHETVFYDEQMERNMSDRQTIINEMQMAINQKQFQLFLQPKYSLQDEQLVGAEALVRWIHPKRGMIPPAQFIPVFEGNGFIVMLDRYMWESTCQLLHKWKKENIRLIPISVNVSRISMFSPSTVQFLKNLIKKYEIDPKYLQLELTESAYIDDPKEMKNQLRELQQAGFVILMDDFGSGYSSLNTLKELPVDYLKLDLKFLIDSDYDLRGRQVISSIIGMSKRLNLEVIAEGVETREKADFLRSIGCEYVQGFLFAKPMPVAEYEKLLKEDIQTES